MSNLHFPIFAWLVVAAAALLPGAVSAQSREPQNSAARQQRAEAPTRPRAQEGRRERSMSESVRWAQKSTGGQVLGAERVQSDGRNFNRVKLIDGHGRVRYVDDLAPGRQPPRAAAPPREPMQGQPREPMQDQRRQ